MELVNKIKTISTQMKEMLKPKSDIMALSDRQINIIIQCFNDPAYTTSAKDIISSLRNNGLEYPERVIRDALLENLLYVEAIELTKDDWQNMLLALDEWGETLWYKWSNAS